jgi:hypothetical protein
MIPPIRYAPVLSRPNPKSSRATPGFRRSITQTELGRIRPRTDLKFLPQTAIAARAPEIPSTNARTHVTKLSMPAHQPTDQEHLPCRPTFNRQPRRPSYTSRIYLGPVTAELQAMSNFADAIWLRSCVECCMRAQEQARDSRHPVDARRCSLRRLAASGANPFDPGSISGLRNGLRTVSIALQHGV